MKIALITICVGLSLAIPAWVGITGSPTMAVVYPWTTVHPYPALTVIAALFSAVHGWGLAGALLLWPALFLLWNPGLVRGARVTPWRTHVLWLTITLLSIPWFANYFIDWHDYSKHWHDVQDIQKWQSLAEINGVWAGLVGLMLLRFRGVTCPDSSVHA